MKTPLKTLIAAMALLIFSTSAQASLSYITCSNGTIEEVGDGLLQVDILEDGIEITPYESSFDLDFEQVEHNNGTFYVNNQNVTYTSEGEEYNSVVDAILFLNDANTELNITYSVDKGVFHAHTLKCETKVIDIGV